MKTKFLILAVLAFLISPLFAQESEIIDYPHNLQEFYEKLDEAFPDDTEITSMSFDDWSYFKSGPCRSVILKWLNSNENPVFFQNINPQGYKLKDYSYLPILADSYWSYKNGVTFDFDTRYKEREPIDFPDYPQTLQEFYDKLNSKFPEYEADITSLDLDNFVNKYYWSKLGICIGTWINFNENAEFLNSINPNGYRVHKESYRTLLMSCYWSYKNNVEYDLDLAFEIQDRYEKSSDMPTKLPLSDLVVKRRFTDLDYEYKGLTAYETISIYMHTTDTTDSNVYIYSYHFGWIVLTEKEYNDMLASPDWETILRNYFQTVSVKSKFCLAQAKACVHTKNFFLVGF